jgi:amino acid adenylation domain-containing protein
MAPCTEKIGRATDQGWESRPINFPPFDAAAWSKSQTDTNMNPLETLGLLWMVHHLIFDRSVDDATMERIDDAVGEVRWMTVSWDPDATIITLGSNVRIATAKAHTTTPTGTIWFTPKRRHDVHGNRVFPPLKSTTAMVLELNWLLVAQDMQPCATLWYKSTVLDSIMAQRLARTFSRLTYCVLTQPEVTVGKWDWVTREDKAVLQRWNPPYLPTALTTLAEILQMQVQKRPNSPTICAWDGEWTYHQLEMHSSMLAGYLIRLGVQPGEMVALRADKSKWSVAAMISILKVGATCIPIDVRNPIKRVGQILKQTKAQILVTTQDTARINLPASVHEFIVPRADQMENQKTESLPQMDLSAVAFVFYTSGSTGVPKGVIQGHRAISGRLKENLVSMDLNCDSRTFQYASYAFDPCIMDIFGTFLVGGCVCIPSESQRLEELAATICHMRASHLCVTPTILATLCPGQVPTLVCVSLGGESVSVELVQLWSSQVRLVALYGTTESVLWDTYYEFQTPHDNQKLIGQGIGSNIWIVDPDNPERLMPLGAIGELLVSGPLVADGYLDTDVKTMASFIQTPPWLRWFRAKGVDRLYRTGDLARYHSDGNIEIIGRRDRQVKMHGQRIELSEIESALRLKLPSEVDCVAEVISSKLRQGTKTLAIFLYSATGPISENRLSLLRVELTQDLPAYMIPSAWITLETPVPRTLSGKVDRSALRHLGEKWSPIIRQLCSSIEADEVPVPVDNDCASPHDLVKKPAATAHEHVLRQLWEQVFKLAPSAIARESQFFELGGDSVVAMQLVALARKHDWSLSVKDVLTCPCLSDMATRLESLHSQMVEGEHHSFAPFGLLTPPIGVDGDAFLTTNLKHDGVTVEAQSIESSNADTTGSRTSPNLYEK